jgi:hypothetical protein
VLLLRAAARPAAAAAAAAADCHHVCHPCPLPGRITTPTAAHAPAARVAAPRVSSLQQPPWLHSSSSSSSSKWKAIWRDLAAAGCPLDQERRSSSSRWSRAVQLGPPSPLTSAHAARQAPLLGLAAAVMLLRLAPPAAVSAALLAGTPARAAPHAWRQSPAAAPGAALPRLQQRSPSSVPLGWWRRAAGPAWAAQGCPRSP